jgi:hypothetical protein
MVVRNLNHLTGHDRPGSGTTPPITPTTRGSAGASTPGVRRMVTTGYELETRSPCCLS